MSSMISNLTRISGEDANYVAIRGNLLGYENRPHDVKCEIYYTSWEDVTNKLKSFNVKRAGFLYIPRGTIVLKNIDGYFTSGSKEIGLNRRIRIRAKLRNDWYELLDGAVYKVGESPDLGTKSVRGDLKILLRSYKGQVLLNDTITYNYADKGWTCRMAIDNFLQSADSGYDTGLRLITDEGAIHTTRAPKNPNKRNLVSAIKSIADEIGYDGFLMDQAGYIVLKEISSVPANPPISYYHPFLDYNPEFDIDEVFNHIDVWGGTDQGFPVNELWTERGVARFEPVAWTGDDANCVVTDDTEYVDVGDYAIKSERQNSVGVNAFTLDFDKAGYRRPSDGASRLNLNQNRFDELYFRYRHSAGAGACTCYMYLIDNVAKEAYIDGEFSDGSYVTVTEGVQTTSHGNWTVDSGFNWAEIAKLRMSSYSSQAVGTSMYIDGLRFTGGLMEINPLNNPTHNPPHTDASSIASYERRIYHETETQPHCFEDAYVVGELVLSIYKNPFKKLRIKQGFKPWLMPHNVVKLTMPKWNIYNADWRAMEIEHDWTTKRKICRTATDIVPATWKLPTETALKAKLGSFLKVIS